MSLETTVTTGSLATPPAIRLRVVAGEIGSLAMRAMTPLWVAKAVTISKEISVLAAVDRIRTLLLPGTVRT